MAKTPNRYPDLSIDGNIAVSGTVDGQDVAAHTAETNRHFYTFIQQADPVATAVDGDVWIETSA